MLSLLLQTPHLHLHHHHLDLSHSFLSVTTGFRLQLNFSVSIIFLSVRYLIGFEQHWGNPKDVEALRQCDCYTVRLLTRFATTRIALSSAPCTIHLHFLFLSHPPVGFSYLPSVCPVLIIHSPHLWDSAEFKMSKLFVQYVCFDFLSFTRLSLGGEFLNLEFSSNKH